MSEDLIRYDILTQDALRKMIASLLEEVARTGLPGDHHFFITFDTRAKNVQLSPRMKEKYPEEMTIVVQHRFWELEITPEQFQIGLSFDEIPELLKIPFASIKGFYDPSVKFGLQFEVHEEEEIAPAPTLVEVEPTPKKNEDVELFEEGAPQRSKAKKKKTAKKKKPADAVDEDNSESEKGADVVSLDSFRKKK